MSEDRNGYLAPVQSPQLNLSTEELSRAKRNRQIREKFEVEVRAEEERLQRGLSGEERAAIRKRLLAEEP